MKSLMVLAMLAMSCGLAVSDFQAQARAAKACTEIDHCVLAGDASCLCATPVNAAQAKEIDDAAAMVACGGAQVECLPMLNPRCLNGQCVAD